MNGAEVRIEPQPAYHLVGGPKSEEVSDPEGHAGTSPRERANKIVLVVDDEDTVADSVTEILRSKGYEAIAAYNGKSAIEIAHRECPDILMCDVLMPSLNGVETAIAVRNACPEVRVLLFSGHAATVNILEEARAAGYEFELMHKPIHPEQLLKRLASSDKRM